MLVGVHSGSVELSAGRDAQGAPFQFVFHCSLLATQRKEKPHVSISSAVMMVFTSFRGKSAFIDSPIFKTI